MGRLSKLALSVLSLAVFTPNAAATNFGGKKTITFTPGNGSLLLGSSDASVNVVLDGADWPGVLRAGHDLAVDFGRVTGVNGSVTVRGNKGNKSADTIFNVTGIPQDWSVPGKERIPGKGTIIAGTIGNSSLIDELVKSGKIDVSAIEGQWEAYVSTIVKNPINGTSEALVIAGKCHSPPSSQPKDIKLTSHRQRPPRHYLRPLRPLRTNRRLPLALVGRRTRKIPLRHLRPPHHQSAEIAHREVPRLLHQRRSPRPDWLDERALPQVSMGICLRRGFLLACI